MKFLGYAYRFVSNFAFLAMVYYSLNFIDKYELRSIVAALVLIHAIMRAITVMRSFYFFQRVERLEQETRRLAGLAGGGPAEASARKVIVTDVSDLRRAGEMVAYMDLLFLILIVLLCVAKIAT